MGKNIFVEINRCVPVPKGYKSTVCPICHSAHLTGILLNESADEQDPDIICKDCGTIITEKIV